MKTFITWLLLLTGLFLFAGIAGLDLAFFINEFEKHQNRSVIWYPDEVLSLELGIICYFVFLFSAGVASILLAAVISKLKKSRRPAAH